MNKKLIYPKRAYELVGACFEVYKKVGNGFTEPVYQECLEIELELRNIPFESQPSLPFFYKGRKTKKRFVPDFICFETIILEIKALDRLVKANDSQVLNYLRATGMRLGILANFGHNPKLEYKRLVR
ncbi:MAG: GxxExxY protein [Pyrinomonadaceae bacterium]|nr:GxxExxY protein [Pyrinomonadaceae bacterium]